MNSTKMEKELNSVLLKNETKNCITPDTLFEKVNKNVRFQPEHEYTTEQLIPRRLYVVNGDIEVFDSMDLPQYSEIDKPSYRVHMECSERKGFVKLRLLENVSRSGKPLECITTKEPKPSTSITSEDETYDYTRITDLKTPKRISIDKTEGRRDTLPETCFYTTTVKKLDADIEYDPDEDESITEDMFYEQASFIRSRGFMEYFQNSIFPGSLGNALGFNEDNIQQATAVPGIIFCNLDEDEEDKTVSCEVIPAISITWPVKYTFEFEMRTERPIITDKIKGIRYKWPTDEMIEDIKKVNTVVIPTGYLKKKNSTEENEIEWEIAFPRAERYIETRMSHAQIKCFLILITLHKTFIELDAAQLGLLIEHYRNHMYWECETNYRDWPEHRLGYKMLKVIENLKSKLSKNKLSNYFIKQKNMFENIPKKYLFHANQMLHKITESPLMYFIKALDNLKFLNGSKFYPSPNCKKLYKILTTDGVKYTNPSLVSQVSMTSSFRRWKDEDQEHYLKRLQLNRQKMIRKKLDEKRKRETNLSGKKKSSTNSFNLEWVCEKSFGALKTNSILTFFIEHFIEIGRKSIKFGATEQSLFYLKQAWYLTKLLEEIDGCKINAQTLQAKINNEEEIVKQMAAMEHADMLPPTPQRNSMQFSFDIKQQSNRNNVTLQNSVTNPNQVKRLPSNLKNRTTSQGTPLNNDRRLKPEGEVTGRKSVAFMSVVNEM